MSTQATMIHLISIVLLILAAWALCGALTALAFGVWLRPARRAAEARPSTHSVT